MDCSLPLTRHWTESILLPEKRRVHRVIILGAGFGGLAASRKLFQQAVDVTVVDKHNYQTLQPLPYEVATAGLDPDDIAYPVRAVIGGDPNINFRLSTGNGDGS
jgi:NADH dehydrogenase